MTLKTLRSLLAQGFEDNIKEKGKVRFIVYLSQGFLLLSTIVLFISTWDSILHHYDKVLHNIDLVITFFFTIEIILRIWTAGELHPEYRGWRGKLRYCSSFYGLIDILSTFPFYLTLVVDLHFTYFRILRVVRMMRIFRYIPAFSILRRAVSSKRKELLVSLQFLVIVTVLLSFVLYFVEHPVQPKVYDNGLTSALWAFAQYLGDPVSFINMTPITKVGQTVAFCIGILGIAIFAVPAGIIGSSFTEIMEQDRIKEEHYQLNKELYNAFQRQQDRPTGFQIVPRYMLFNDIQARLSMTADEVMIAARQNDDFRIISLSIMIPVNENLGRDSLAVELCVRNTPYGCCIDRGSNITIVNPSSVVDPVIGHFAYYLALIGGFNYISRESGIKRPYKSFYLFDDENSEQYLTDYMNDLRSLTNRKGAFCWTILACSGSLDISHPTQFHFSTGQPKGNESFEGEGFRVKDMNTFKKFYDHFSQTVEEKYGFTSDHNRYFGFRSPRLYANKLDPKVSVLSLRIAWAVTAWSSNNIAIAKELADSINYYFNAVSEPQYAETLRQKKIGFDNPEPIDKDMD